MKKEFGDVLKDIRIDRGYSQQYVAEGIMGQSAYSKNRKKRNGAWFSKMVGNPREAECFSR